MAIENPVMAEDHPMPGVAEILASTQQSKSSMFAEVQGLLDNEAKPKEPAKPAVAPAKPTEKPAAQNKPAAKTETSRIPGPPVEDDKPASTEPDEPPRDWNQAKLKPNNWKALHALRDAAEQKAKEYEAKIKEYEARQTQQTAIDPKIKENFDKIQSERDQLSQMLEAVAAERHPRIQAQFQDRTNEVIARAKSIVGGNHADTVEKLLKMPESEWRNSQLESIYEDLPGIQKAKFGSAIADADRIHSERQHMAQRGSEIWKQLNEQSTAQQQKHFQESQAKLISAFDEEIKAWSKMPMFAKREGDDEHNAAVDSRIELAKSIFSGGMKPNELARASAWAALGPDLARESKALTARVAELESELKSLRSSDSTLPGDGTGSPQTESPEPDPNASAGSQIAKLVARAGFLR